MVLEERVAAGLRRCLVAVGVVVLLLGCSGGGESGEAASVAGEEISDAEQPEAVAAVAVPAKKRLSGVERRRVREAQEEFAKGFDLLWGRQGVHDKKQAHVHLLKAAELGHAQSQSIVGVSLMKGRGTERDFEEGMRWLMIAAENGWPHAQLKLGEAYRDGRGVEKDPVEAMKWLALSGRGGSIAGGMIAPSYAAALPPEQRREGIERARAWRIERGLPVKDLSGSAGSVRPVLVPEDGGAPQPVPAPPAAETAQPAAPAPKQTPPVPEPPAAGA